MTATQARTVKFRIEMSSSPTLQNWMQWVGGETPDTLEGCKAKIKTLVQVYRTYEFRIVRVETVTTSEVVS